MYAFHERGQHVLFDEPDSVRKRKSELFLADSPDIIERGGWFV
jgi:hypothetical protein